MRCGYIEVSNMHGDGIQSVYWRAAPFRSDSYTSLWIVPGTLEITNG